MKNTTQQIEKALILLQEEEGTCSPCYGGWYYQYDLRYADRRGIARINQAARLTASPSVPLSSVPLSSVPLANQLAGLFCAFLCFFVLLFARNV